MTIDQELIDAAAAGETETARVLLGRGADINSGCDVALYLAVRYGHPQTWDLLLDSGANLDSALLLAAEHGHTKTVVRLLNLGANIIPN